MGEMVANDGKRPAWAKPGEEWGYGTTVVQIHVAETSLTVPRETPEELREIVGRVLKLGRVRDSELVRIEDWFKGGLRAKNSKYFPIPAGVKSDIWRAWWPLLTPINLVVPAVKTWTRAVYSGRNIRRVVSAPDNIRAQLEEWVGSARYLKKMMRHRRNALLFGTSVAVPTVNEDGVVDLTLFDAVHTWVIVDPWDVERPIAVAEVKGEIVRFVCLNGFGTITKRGGKFVVANFGILPVSIWYGEDELEEGNPHGRSRVGEAVDMSISVTDVHFNIRIMQKLQTRSLLVIKGKVESSKQAANLGPTGGIEVEEGGDAKFIHPEPKIDETIKIIRTQVGLLATELSIPQDVLDATITEAAQAAESARIRAIPLIQEADLLAKEWQDDERQLILMGAAMLEFNRAEGGNVIKMADIRRRVKVDVEIEPDVVPATKNEKVANGIALRGARIRSAEDTVREFNPTKSETEIAELVKEMEEQEAKSVNPAAAADAELKAKKAAMSD